MHVILIKTQCEIEGKYPAYLGLGDPLGLGHVVFAKLQVLYSVSVPAVFSELVEVVSGTRSHSLLLCDHLGLTTYGCLFTFPRLRVRCHCFLYLLLYDSTSRPNGWLSYDSIVIVVKTDALFVASSFGTTAPASASGVRELVALLLVDCCVHFQ